MEKHSISAPMRWFHVTSLFHLAPAKRVLDWPFLDVKIVCLPIYADWHTISCKFIKLQPCLAWDSLRTKKAHYINDNRLEDGYKYMKITSLVDDWILKVPRCRSCHSCKLGMVPYPMYKKHKFLIYYIMFII
jgi:hypothetical protein